MPYSKNSNNLKICLICNGSFYRKRRLQECCSNICSLEMTKRKNQENSRKEEINRGGFRVCNICNEKKLEIHFHQQKSSRKKKKVYLNFCKSCWLERRKFNRIDYRDSGAYDKDMDRGHFGWTDRLIDRKIWPTKRLRSNEKMNIWEKCFEKSRFNNSKRYSPLYNKKIDKNLRLENFIKNLFKIKQFKSFSKHELLAEVYVNTIRRKASTIKTKMNYNAWENRLTYLATTSLVGVKRILIKTGKNEN